MPDYSKGKIYKLISNHTDDIYIGSTCDLLPKRLYQHKHKYESYQNGKGDYVSSFEICKYDDVRILLMKEYPCENKQQLERKEGKYQEKYECVNNRIAGSKGICKHDKRKHRCRDCDGNGFCKHDKRKDTCRECGGSAICKHDKIKSKCRECGGSAFCKHDKIKSTCRECGGSAICKHDKIKNACVDCGGSQTIKTKCPLCDKEMRKDTIKKHINKIH